MEKSNRVLGFIMVKGFMKHFDKEGTSSGNLFSNVYLKHEFRQYWNQKNEKVFSYITDTTHWNRYYTLFHKKPNEQSSQDKVNNMFSCVDIQHFGGKIPGMGNHIVNGAVSFSNGIKIPLNTTWRPIRTDNNVKDRYIYDFSIRPNYNNVKHLFPDLIGYTEESYQLFKDASKYAITQRRSNDVEQGENELTLLVEMKEDAKMTPKLSQLLYSEVDKHEMTLDLSMIVHRLNSITEFIKSAEIYYNPNSLSLIGLEENSLIQIYELPNKQIA